MAASEPRQTDAVQSTADEKWVLLQDGGDVAKELLLEEQDGQENALDVGKFLGWCRSAWKDVPVRNDIWDDIRPYVLGVTLSVNTVLHLFTDVASHAESAALHVRLTSLDHVTMAVLCTAVFSYATRFVSLLAAKASVVKRLEMGVLLFGLLVTNVVILLAACFACVHEVIAGFKVCPLTQREKCFEGYLPVDVVRGVALMVAVVLAPSLVLLTKTDVAATFRTFLLHRQETKEARELFIRRWLLPLKRELMNTFITIVYMLVFFMIVGILMIIQVWVTHAG